MIEQLLVHVILHVYLILQKEADTYGRTASGTCNFGVYLILQKQADTYGRTAPGTCNSRCLFDPTEVD